MSRRMANAARKRQLTLDDFYVDAHGQYWREVVAATRAHGGDGNGEVVAILDSGFLPVSHSLVSAKSVDFTGEGLVDVLGHGTTISSLIAALAPGAEQYHVKVFNRHGQIAGGDYGGKIETIEKAFRHVEEVGATIVSISWNFLTRIDYHSTDVRPGFTCNCPICSVITSFARRTNIDVIVSEGNYLKRETGAWSCPAAAEWVTPVFAVSGGRRCFDSNLATSAGIPAPNEITVKWPNASRFARAIAWVTNSESLNLSGSSFSTALVAGTYAALKSALRKYGFNSISIPKSLDRMDENAPTTGYTLALDTFFFPTASENSDHAAPKDWQMFYRNCYNTANRQIEIGQRDRAGQLCLLAADLMYIALPFFSEADWRIHASKVVDLYMRGIANTGHCELDIAGKMYVKKLKDVFSWLRENGVNCEAVEADFEQIHSDNTRKLKAGIWPLSPDPKG